MYKTLDYRSRDYIQAFVICKRLSIAKNCLRPYNAPLRAILLILVPLSALVITYCIFKLNHLTCALYEVSLLINA